MQYSNNGSGLKKIIEIIRKYSLNDFHPDYFSVNDMIDIVEITEILENLYNASGIPSGLIAKNGEVLVSVGWQAVCVYFHRVNPETYKNCIESDAFIFNPKIKSDRLEYKCKNGMWDIALRLKIFNYHFATIFIGQFFFENEEIDYPFFKRQAKKYGFDEEIYLNYIKKVPVFSREKVNAILDLFSSLLYSNIRKCEERIKTAIKTVVAERNEVNSFFIRKNCMAVLNQISEGVFEYHSKTKQVIANSTFYKQINISDDMTSFSLKDWIEIIIPEDRIMFEKHFAECSDMSVSFEYRLRYNDEIRHFRVRGNVVETGVDKKSFKLLCTQTDVSYYKKKYDYLSQKNSFDTNSFDDKLLKFLNIFDIERVQKFQDSFSETIGLTSVIYDNEFNRLTQISKVDFQSDNCINVEDNIRDLIIEFSQKSNRSTSSIKKDKSSHFWYAICPFVLNTRVIAYWYIGNVIVADSYDDIVAQESIKNKLPVFEVKDKIKHLRVLKENQFKSIAENLQVIITQLTENALNNLRQSRYIIEKELIQKRLMLSEKKYRGLFESIHHSFAIHKMLYNERGKPVDYEFIEVNPAFERLVNIAKKDIIGKTVLELLPGTEKYWIETYAKVAKTGKPMTYENYSVELGKSFLVTAFSPEKDYFAVLIQDVSEGVKLKELLTESEQQFNLFANQMPGILWEIDTDLRFISFQGKKLEDLYLKQDKVVGKTLYEFFMTDNQEFLPIKKHILALRGKSQKYDLIYRSLIFESFISPLYDINNNVKGVIGIAIDVTEKRKYEEHYIKDNNLRSLGVLAGGIAHDFNNIFATILGCSSLIKFTYNNPEIQEAMDQIETSCYKAKVLTGHLLTFSKGGAPKYEKIDVNEIIISSVNFVLSGSGLKPFYDFKSKEKYLSADKGQFIQVIQNIVMNSLQAMPEGGKLKITSEDYVLNEDISDLVKGRYLLIKISDTGCGIEQSDLLRVFDPYFTTRFQSNGLGLSVCYSIVKKHQGKIEIASEKGSGTEVSLYFPVEKNDYTEIINSSINDATVNLDKISILIVDDDDFVRKTLGQIFKKFNYETLFCDRGEAAVKIYSDLLERNEKPDMLILDLTIPGGISGVECFKQIKLLDDNVKAILTTGYTNADQINQYLDIGFLSVLSKPFNIKQVLSTINKVLKFKQ